MGGKRQKITNKTSASASSVAANCSSLAAAPAANHSSITAADKPSSVAAAPAANRSSITAAPAASATDNRFRSATHRVRYDRQILENKVIPERFFDLKDTEFPEIQQNLTKRNWIHLPSVIKPVHLDVVREFYANAYIPDEGKKSTPEGRNKGLTSMVRGKVVSYHWRTIDKVLQINYQGGCNVSNRRRIKQKNYLDVDYDELLNFLCRPGSAWIENKFTYSNPAHAPKKIRSEDLMPIARAWCSFFRQTVEPHSYISDMNELTDYVAMGIVAIMKDEEVDISKLICYDIFRMARRLCNSYYSFWGHASIIVRLCEEAGVEDLSGGILRNPSPIDFRWIHNLVLREEANQHRAEEQVQKPQPPPQQPQIQGEEQAQQPQLPPQQPLAQPFQPHDFGDETTIEHRFQMASFCWMQDVSVRLGIPATYLAHQTDMWAAAQRFRERYSGPPPTP